MAKNVYVRFDDNRWEWAKSEDNFRPISNFGRENPLTVEVADGTVELMAQSTRECTVSVSPSSVIVPRGQDHETFTITASCENDPSKPTQSGYIKVKKSG